MYVLFFLFVIAPSDLFGENENATKTSEQTRVLQSMTLRFLFMFRQRFVPVGLNNKSK
jgi:hypothetical protein